MIDRDLKLELNRRDKERYLRELAELESSLVSAQSGVFWATLNLLITGPAITAGIIYYFWTQIKGALAEGLIITNFWSNAKWFSIGIAIIFAIFSLTLLWYLWRLASLQKQITKIRAEISRLE